MGKVHRPCAATHSLSDAVSDILYEVEMFVYTIRWVSHGSRGQLIRSNQQTSASVTYYSDVLETRDFEPGKGRVMDHARNAHLESMLIHSRILLEFFERTRDSDNVDTVYSQDYGFSANNIPLIPSTRLRLNKDLAHLTFDRARRRTTAQKSWKLCEFKALIDRCIEFLEHLKNDVNAKAYLPACEARLQELKGLR